MAEEMQTKTCPYCGEEINVSAIKCKHCGEFLEEKQENVSGTKVCPFCGEEILASAVKCKHCGEFLNESAKGRSTLATFFFGTFYYLFKGMWLKFLIYSTVILIIAGMTGGTGSAFWVICSVLAPYDYYRLKVLGKQW